MELIIGFLVDGGGKNAGKRRGARTKKKNPSGQGSVL